MQWQDEGIVLGVKRHGESSAIVEIMTREHGRHLGLVRGGRSRRMQPVLQPGNGVSVTWRARLDQHLGSFQIEPVELRAARLMETGTGVYGVQAMGALLRLLPERDPHGHLFEALGIILNHLHQPMDAGELFVRFEIAVLEDLGFGLDLTRCAATGAKNQLQFVSPKSGRAVSREAGMPWQDKLLTLPSFLADGSRHAADPTSLEEAFRLTGFFLHRHVYEPRGMEMPDSRAGFIQAVLKAHLVSHKPDEP
ncbi:MAG: DNA repair protein RecO [Alphaproteobacteria bacterium]|nr:DNA repair protein RecO [Alphaproteobacteria bacterium]